MFFTLMKNIGVNLSEFHSLAVIFLLNSFQIDVDDKNMKQAQLGGPHSEIQVKLG